jgi:hypothetical protein
MNDLFRTMLLSTALIVSTSHAQQSQNTTVPTAPALTTMQNAQTSVPFDQFMIYRTIMQEENKRFQDFIDTHTDRFEKFIYTILGTGFVVISAILAFLGWKMASDMRKQYDTIVAKHLDRAEKQIDISIKAAADEQIATKVAELRKRIDEVFAKVQVSANEFEEVLRQRKWHVDRWLSNISYPPEPSG